MKKSNQKYNSQISPAGSHLLPLLLARHHNLEERLRYLMVVVLLGLAFDLLLEATCPVDFDEDKAEQQNGQTLNDDEASEHGGEG